MTGRPRRNRARGWSWLYLALFGDGTEPDGDTTRVPADDQQEVHRD